MILRKGIDGATAGFDYDPVPGKRWWSVGIDVETQMDHTAVVAIEKRERLRNARRQKVAKPGE